MARTYEVALSKLAALQSNQAITSLFTPPASDPVSPKRDLNALAIPEMLAWLRRAGLSQDDLASRLRCIHVAGTKGKGSVCAYLTALLVQGDEKTRATAGRVGTYTSPHLVSVRERIAIDGAPISQDLFARYFFEVWDACTEAARAELATQGSTGLGGREGQGGISEEELRGPATKPFYFRFLTLVALRAFLGEGVRSVVMECGIGAEYDSTNILPMAAVTATVVSQLGIDHVSMLGVTLPEIAWHKAGVCKQGRRCFTRLLRGPDAESTMRVLRQRAEEKGATLVEVEDGEVELWGGVRPGGKGVGFLEGDFQKYNQALAVRAAREHLRVLAPEAGGSGAKDSTIMSEERLEDIPSSFISALQYARLRGRCETREDEQAPITWLIDGAHTAESLAVVAQWFVGKVDKNTETVLLFNQQDRDAAKLVHGLLANIEAGFSKRLVDGEKRFFFTHAIFTRNDQEPRQELEQERDLAVQRAAAGAFGAASPLTSTSVFDNVADAVAEARKLANGNDRTTTVLATGSLYLVGSLLHVLEPNAEC
ncbi:FolC bifunctional protein [Xylaria sp. CBS 124048]|nr:FolC bifunctional protein [Xylaria sp. CBS 124048]